MMMLIQLRRILIHNLIRCLHGTRMLESRRSLQLIGSLFLGFYLLLLLRMFVLEQVLDRSFARGALVYGECRGELLVCANLDSLEEIKGEVLAVVADQVVGWTSFAHFVDCHFGWG
jgi:hypothetical protein